MNNNINYSGNLHEYQQQGHSTPHIQKLLKSEPRLNKYQTMLYDRAVQGLYAYDHKVVKNMHWHKQKRIKHLHKRATQCINLLKQEVVNDWCNKIFGTMFPTGNASFLFSSKDIEADPEFVSNLELNSLGVSKHMIIDRLLLHGVLPKDFYDLRNASKT